jgi:ribosomal protein S18 acetylase RimI-like enzyme
MELVQITLMAEKQKWLQRFRKNYAGSVRSNNPSRIYREELSRFFVAKSDDAEVGFIQLTNYSHWLKSSTQPNFWSAGMAYVKPPYRQKGVLRYMLTECIEKHQVGAAYMESERLITNSDYYRSLGFCRAHLVDDNYFVYLIHSQYEASYLDRMETDEAANDSSFTVSA